MPTGSFNDRSKQFIVNHHGPIWLLLIASFALRPVADFDTFWQLQSGRHIWTTKAFIYQDLFSVAAAVFRMEHCWLHDLILYGGYVVGGFGLLGLLKTMLLVTCAVLLLWWSRRQQVAAAVALPVLTLCLLASEPSWALRPQLWTFILALLYLMLLHLGRERGWRVWTWLVPLMLIWVNLHAAAVFGFVLIGLFGIAEVVRALQGQTGWRRCGELALIGLAAFAVAFINPYGYKIPLSTLFAHLNQLKMVTGNAASTFLHNMEWLPPNFAQVPLFYVVMGLWAGLLLWRWRRLDPVEVIMFVAFAYMGFSQIRHTTLVSLLAGVYLPGAVAQTLPQTWLGKAPLATVTVLLCLLLLGFGGYRTWQGVWGGGLKRNEFPVAATDFLIEQGLPGQIYNSYDWGGYLMWRLYPEHLVFVDSRSDSPEHFDASTRIDEAWDGWEAALDRYGINTIISRTCFYDSGGALPLIDRLAVHPRWVLVYQDDEAVIYLRRSVAEQEQFKKITIDSRLAYETRIAEANRLLREDWARPRSMLAIGVAHLKLGRIDQAKEWLGRYLEKVPEDLQARQLLSMITDR